MYIQVVGAGSLGMLLAGKLSKTSARVELFCRSEVQGLTLRKRGLTVTGQGNELTTYLPVFTIGQPIPERNGIGEQPEWIFLAVKQKDITEELVSWLKYRLEGQARLVLFQNGIGHVEVLAAELPLERLYIAITTEAAKRCAQHVVQYTGRGMTYLGRAGGHGQAATFPFDETEKRLQLAMMHAGMEVKWTKDIQRYVWQKLLINSIINPLTAILKVKNGELPSSPNGRQLMRTLYEEGCQLAEHIGVELAPDLWEQVLQVCEKTAENHSSMLQDIQEGRTTEIEWINGSLLKLASRHGFSLPTHETMNQMIKVLEHRNSRQTSR